jgi:hypothetical protein
MNPPKPPYFTTGAAIAETIDNRMKIQIWIDRFLLENNSDNLITLTATISLLDNSQILLSPFIVVIWGLGSQFQMTHKV